MSENQALIEALREDGVAQPIGDARRFWSVGHGRQTVDLEDLLEKHRPAPRRKKGTYHVHDAESFLTYLDKHHDAGSLVWADLPQARITGVLNAHGADYEQSDSDGAAWEDHRVVYAVLLTDAWKAWIGNDGKLLSQTEFAEHIEDRAIDIVQPSSADMLEIAQTFHATNNVEFQSGTRLDSGQRQLRYREQVDAKAGRAGDLTIPEKFTLVLQPFEGADPYRVTARLRYRIADGNLRIGYKLERPNDALREAFAGVVAKVAEGTDVPVLRGSV